MAMLSSHRVLAVLLAESSTVLCSSETTGELVAPAAESAHPEAHVRRHIGASSSVQRHPSCKRSRSLEVDERQTQWPVDRSPSCYSGNYFWAAVP